MFSHASMVHHAVLLTCCLALTSGAANACDGPREVREATLASIKAFIHTKQMTVLTFAGYSGAQYENPQVLTEHASRVLDKQDPARALINIGATAEGIGAVYEIAKRRGFTTMGIVSTLARDERVALSKCVDYVFLSRTVPGEGGFLEAIISRPPLRRWLKPARHSLSLAEAMSPERRCSQHVKPERRSPSFRQT